MRRPNDTVFSAIRQTEMCCFTPHLICSLQFPVKQLPMSPLHSISGRRSSRAPASLRRHNTSGLLDQYAACASSTRQRWAESTSFSVVKRSGHSSKQRSVHSVDECRLLGAASLRSATDVALQVDNVGYARSVELPDLYTPVLQLYEEDGLYQYSPWSEDPGTSSTDTWESEYVPYFAFQEQDVEEDEELLSFSSREPTPSPSRELPPLSDQVLSLPIPSTTSTPIRKRKASHLSSDVKSPAACGAQKSVSQNSTSPKVPSCPGFKSQKEIVLERKTPSRALKDRSNNSSPSSTCSTQTLLSDSQSWTSESVLTVVGDGEDFKGEWLTTASEGEVVSYRWLVQN